MSGTSISGGSGLWKQLEGYIKSITKVVVDGRLFVGDDGLSEPIFDHTEAYNAAYFQNGDVIIERDGVGAPQIKFKSNSNPNNHVALIAFKDFTTFGDGADIHQFVISTKNKEHATKPEEFNISEQLIDGSWKDPFVIEKGCAEGALQLTPSGLVAEALDNSVLMLTSNGVGYSGSIQFKDSGDNEIWLFSVKASDNPTMARQFQISEWYQSSTWYDPFVIKPQTPTGAMVLDPSNVTFGIPIVSDQTVSACVKVDAGEFGNPSTNPPATHVIGGVQGAKFTVGTDLARYKCPIPVDYAGGTMELKLYWTRSTTGVDQTKTVKWQVRETDLSAGSNIAAVDSTLSTQDSYSSAEIVDNIVEETAGLTIPASVAGSAHSFEVKAITPTGTSLSEPVLLYGCLAYTAKVIP